MTEVAGYVERFAGVLMASGIPPMSARVMARIMVEPSGSMTASELAESLQISQPAVSGAVRTLIEIDFIRRERVPGSRKDHYRVHEEPWPAVLERRNRALKDWERSAQEGAELVGTDTDAGRRLAGMADFFGFIRVDLEQVLDRWQAHRRA